MNGRQKRLGSRVHQHDRKRARAPSKLQHENTMLNVNNINLFRGTSVFREVFDRWLVLKRERERSEMRQRKLGC